MNLRGVGVWLAVGVVWAAGAGGARAGYEVTDLGFLPGGTFSQGSAISRGGQVAGSANDGTRTAAFLSDPAGRGLTDLGTFAGGGVAHGVALNDGGTVVGDGTSADGHTHGFFTTGGAGLRDVGLLPGTTDGFATGVNDAGQIVGYGVFAGPAGLTHAFLRSNDGLLTDLGTLGGLNSLASGINPSGVVVGSSQTIWGHYHAFVATPGGLHDLGGLPGGSDTSFGAAINGHGAVVGYGGFAESFHAFRTLTNGQLQDLGTLDGAVSSQALGVNDLGVVVGTSGSASGSSRAFLFSDATRLVDLNQTLVNGGGWTLESATGVNDRGQITGYGEFQGARHAFLLTPESPAAVPEPGAWLLTGMGLLGLAAARARLGIGNRSATTSVNAS